MDDKYIVFKRNVWNKCITEMQDRHGVWPTPQPVEDAVVIRRQDVFAPPALDAYSNSILVALELMNEDNPLFAESARGKRLAEVAAYFHSQAATAWDANRKLPD